MGLNKPLSVFLLAINLVVVSCSVTKKQPSTVAQTTILAPIPTLKENIGKDTFFEDLKYPSNKIYENLNL